MYLSMNACMLYVRTPARVWVGVVACLGMLPCLHNFCADVAMFVQKSDGTR